MVTEGNCHKHWSVTIISDVEKKTVEKQLPLSLKYFNYRYLPYILNQFGRRLATGKMPGGSKRGLIF